MKTLNDIITDVMNFKKANPTAFFRKGKDISTKLQFIIEAITDDGTVKEFIVPMGAITRGSIPEEKHKIVRKYLEARCELNEAASDFVKLFTLELN